MGVFVMAAPWVSGVAFLVSLALQLAGVRMWDRSAHWPARMRRRGADMELAAGAVMGLSSLVMLVATGLGMLAPGAYGRGTAGMACAAVCLNLCALLITARACADQRAVKTGMREELLEALREGVRRKEARHDGHAH